MRRLLSVLRWPNLVGATAFAALGSAGCGSPPAALPATPTAVTANTATVAAPTTDNNAPVGPPKNVLLSVRGNDIGKSVASLDKIIKLPKSLKSYLDAGLAEKSVTFINMSASFDLMVALDPQSSDKEPKFVWAGSIPLTSVEAAADAARKDGDEVRATTQGAYRTRSKGNTVCDITPTAGDSPARAICSDDEEGLRELSPWLSRGAPLQPKKPVDLWMRAEAGPLKERYMPFLRAQADDAINDLMKESKGLPLQLDQELLDVPSVLAREALAFGDDTDSFEMSFNIDPNQPEMRLVGTLGFKSRTSWVTELVARGSERAEPPPDFFYRIPKDAMTATWSRAADPALFTGIRRIFHKAATTSLTLATMLSDADKRSFVNWIDTVPSFSGEWVSASGGPSFKPETKGKLSAGQAVDEAKEMAKHYLPWGISGGEGDPAAMIAWMKQSEDTWNRGLAVVKKELGKKSSKDLSMVPTVKFSENPAGYPKGSAALDVDVKFTSKDVWELLPQNKYQEQPGGKWGRPEAPKTEAKGNVTLRIVVVPDDAGHYWFGYSVDLDALKKHILAAQKGAPVAGTLAARTDLAILKNHKGFGGFVSYGTLLDSLKNTLSSSDARDFNDAMASMPHKGQTPLFFLGSSTPGSAPTLTFELVAQKDWLEDMAGVTQFAVKKAIHEKENKPSPVVPSSEEAKPPVTKTGRPPKNAPKR